MAKVDPKLGDFGALKKIYDFSEGLYTVRPREDIPENATPYAKNVVHSKHHALSKIWGSAELLAISTNLYNRFIKTNDYVYALYPYVTPEGKSSLIIQGKANSSHSLYSDSNMSLFSLDVQTSYPASVNATRILGADTELSDNRRCTFATYKGRLYTWNGADYLRYWNSTDWRNYHTDKGERFKYLATYGRRLWAASSGSNPSRLIYSNLNYCTFHHYFVDSTTNYIDFNSPTDYSPIMWITQFKNRLLIFKQNSIYAFYGDPDTSGINFDIVAHNIGTINGWSVQVHNDRCYFAGKDGIYMYGDYGIIASQEDRRVQTEPNVIRISSEIDDWWKDNFTLPSLGKTQEISRAGYEDFCSTLAFTAGGDATNFKADDIGIEANDYIRGATSNAVARVAYVDKTGGTWTGGDAAGTLYLTEVYSYLAFDHGGTAAIQVSRKITGATSAATAYVYKVRITSGTFAGGDAAGYILVQLVHGTFENNEHINAEIQSDIADVDGTIGVWTATEKIHIGSKEYATAGTFTQKFRLFDTRLNVAPNSENPDVINTDIERDPVPHTSEQSQTTQDTLQSLRSTNGKNEYYSQSFKLKATFPSDYAICSGVALFLKEIGDVSGDTLKIYICGETDSEPDFNKLYGEGSATGVFLHGVETLIFDSGSEEPKVGDTITEQGGDGSGIVHKVVVTAGEWSDGDAEGILYIKSTAGTWTNESTINITGGTSNIATVNQATDSVAIGAGCWVFVDMDYWDYPQNMYDGSLTDPPVVYVAVKVTGDNDANYLQWGYNSAGGYSTGRMLNSDGETPSGQTDLDYCFNVYCRVFIARADLIIETDTFDGTSSHEYWKSINLSLNDDTLGSYTRKYNLNKIEYLTKATDTAWTDWSTAGETTNGGAIGDGTNLSTYRYARFRIMFTRPAGYDSSKMDSFTLQNIRASSTTEAVDKTLIDSAIHEDGYVLSINDIVDPEKAAS